MSHNLLFESGIVLNRVTFRFALGPTIIENITLTIHSGEFVVIVGPNGSGKTTLARLLNGNLLPTSGNVLVDHLHSTKREQWAIKKKVAYVGPHAENQFMATTVFDEIAFSLQAFQLEDMEIKQRCEEVLETFDLGRYRNIHPFFLSTGEQFRVQLAAAVVRQPKCLVLDEVYSGMDGFSRQQSLSVIVKIQREFGVAVVLLTHRLEDIIQAERVIVLVNGRLVAEGNPSFIIREAIHHPKWAIEPPVACQVLSFLSPVQQREFPELGVSCAA